MSQNDIGVDAPQIITSETQENFPLAIVAGIGTAAVGAVIWAVTAALTQRTFGLVAILIGFLVGRVIQKLGKGRGVKYSVLGASCALLGSVVGNVAGFVAIYATAKGYTTSEVLSILNVDRVTQIATDVDLMTLLIYGIATYEGWRFSVIKDVPAAANKA